MVGKKGVVNELKNELIDFEKMVRARRKFIIKFIIVFGLIAGLLLVSSYMKVKGFG